MKIALIGSGSLVFSSRLIMDVLTFPDLKDITFALMDIDPVRLEYSRQVTERIIKEGNYKAEIIVTSDRQEALEDADFVIIAILSGGIDVISLDIDIPLKYGVDQCIADTLGPGGIFRAMRTIPRILEICNDVEEYCPDAWVLNYTNPMAMLSMAVDFQTCVNYVGLCHSVQGTSEQIAGWIGVPLNEITFDFAGINHQAWALKIERNGEDLYPQLMECIDKPEIYNNETTRFEMLKHLGYFVTESSGHNSEYNPWFRKRPELKEKYTPGGDWNGGTGFIKVLYGTDRVNWENDMKKLASGETPLKFERSHEYGSHIIHAISTGDPFRINGNVSNYGLISNLPEGCCVEVPCLVDKNGITPCYVGDLPLPLAALNRTNISVQELAVFGTIYGDREMIFQAVAYDPLTAAVCSLDEIKEMVDEMFDAEKEWLKDF